MVQSFTFKPEKMHNEKGGRSFEKGGLMDKTVKCQMKKNNYFPELSVML